MIYEPYEVKYTAYREIVEDSDIKEFESLLSRFSHLINPQVLKTLTVYNYTTVRCVPTDLIELNPEAMLQRSLFISKKLPEMLTLKNCDFYALC